MKKNFLIIVIISFFCFVCNAQCQKNYEEALKNYKAGDYIKAQREMVVVVQSCGDWSDAWKVIKNCNKKLEEKQQKQHEQISTLQDVNRKLVKDTARLQSDIRKLRSNTTSLATAAGQVQSLQNEIDSQKKTIQSQNDTIAARDQEIAQLRQRIAEMEKAPSTPTDPNASDNQEHLAQEVAALNNSMENVQSGINQIQNAVNQLKPNPQDDSQSLRKSEIAQLQDSFDDLAKVLEGMNKTLADLSKSVKANQKKPCKLKLWFQKKKEERERKKAEKQDNASPLQ